MLPRALKSFTVKAVVDWMAFDVVLPSASQFRHVLDRMIENWGKTYFTPLGNPASTRKYRFRLNNPPGPDQFMRELQSIVRQGDPPIMECDVRVVGIEIALDAYIEGSCRQALGQAATHMLRHQAHPPAGLPRITGRGYCFEPETPQEVLQALCHEKITINLGKKGADHTARVYVKDYDSKEGEPYAPLPREQWRARLENTLLGAAVPFTTIDGWRSFRFEKALADHFALVVSAAAPNSLPALMQERFVQLGRRPDSPKRRPSDRRRCAPYTRRDVVTNDKIRQALRALTRAQSCQNSVTKMDVQQSTPLASEGQDHMSPKYCIPSSLMQPSSLNPSLLLAQSPMTGAFPEEGSFNNMGLVDVLEPGSVFEFQPVDVCHL